MDGPHLQFVGRVHEGLAGMAFFMKQMGGTSKRSMAPIPPDLMIREFPT
jgi:hypothetical protein